MLNSAKRPLILAGRGIMLSGAMRTFEQFVHASNIPVAMTLLGIGCFPASDPLNLGMMGMHGEAWGDHANQEAGLPSAVRTSFHEPRIGRRLDFRRQTDRPTHDSSCTANPRLE